MGATMTKAAVTPNLIKQAEERTRQLNLLAYAPQPVAQPDGTTINLCWNGRIARAYDRLADARKAVLRQLLAWEREFATAGSDTV
jgi:hypothetical protein